MILLVLAACDTAPPVLAPAAHPAPVEAPPAAVQVLSRSVYLDAIVERSIFDSEKVGGVREEEDGDDAARTELPLVLLGTVLADPAAMSSALIAALDERGRPGSAQGFGVGAEVMEGVTLVQIAHREVTLRRAGGPLERLPISGVDRSQRVPAQALRSAIRRRGSRNYILDEDTFSAASADSIVDGVQLSGEDEGVRLLRASRSTPLYKMGLRSRDLVRSIDGEAVDEPGELKAALRDAVEDERTFSITVERRRRQRTLRYTLE